MGPGKAHGPVFTFGVRLPRSPVRGLDCLGRASWAQDSLGFATYDRCSPLCICAGQCLQNWIHSGPFETASTHRPFTVYPPLRNLIRPFHASAFLLQLVTLMLRCSTYKYEYFFNPPQTTFAMSTRPVQTILPTGKKLAVDNTGELELTSHRRTIVSASAHVHCGLQLASHRLQLEG